MNRIKLIACDMDGTLLNDQKKISRANIEAVHKLKDLDIIFVIATGRHDSMVKSYLDSLGIEMPVISCNGAMVREPFSNHIYSSIPLTNDQTLGIIQVCKMFQADYHIYGRDVIFGETMTSRMLFYRDWNQNLSERDKINLYVSTDYQSYIDENMGEIFKVLIIPQKSDDFRGIEKEIFKSTGLTVSQSDPVLLDVTQKGITKAHAIETLCRELKIDRNETAAIGDHMNDLDMIQYAGIGIGMANGIKEIKDASRFITKKTNNQSGVAEAIEYLISQGGC
jgi:Cof subfamily protein (haloacid dehalogenase superfamily)